MKGKRLKSLGGTVLIMVLTVMLVLIIMLMATLTVVTTASQRIYTKYEEQQAYYTARSALDVFTKMLNDSTYGNYVGLTFETQGYHIQKGLYDIKAQSDPTGTNPVKNTNPYAGAIGVMASQPYIEYEASLPDLNKGTDKYGKFDDGTLKIKVEVLDRTLNCGSDGTPATGIRTKDVMKLKITATTTFEGIEGSAAMTLDTKKPSTSNITRAVTILGGTGFQPTNTTLLGGLATEGTVNLGNTGDFWGDVFLGGTVNITGSGSRFVGTDNQWIYIKDSLDIQNNLPLEGMATALDKVPNYFIDNNVSGGPNTTFGASGPINTIITGDLYPNSNFEHFGNLYVMGNVVQTNAYGSAQTKLKVHGNLYVGGYCDFRIAGSALTVDNQLYTGGSLLVPSNGDGTPNYTNVSVNSSTIAGWTPNGIPSDLVVGVIDGDGNVDAIKDGNGKSPGDAEYSGANGMLSVSWSSSDPAKQIPTKAAIYTQFYRYDDLSEDTVTASEYAFTDSDGLLSPNFNYSDERIHKYQANNSSNIQTKAFVGGSITSAGKYTIAPGNFGASIFNINAPGQEVELFLSHGTYNYGTILVHSGTTLKVYAEPGSYNFDNFHIITDEVAGTDNLYVGKDTGNIAGVSLMSMPILYYFEGESNINMINSALFVGHFYAPRSKVDTTSAYDLDGRIFYNGVQYDKTGIGWSILGSILCQSYKAGDNKGGVAFVQATETPPQNGLPSLQFNASQYTRQ